MSTGINKGSDKPQRIGEILLRRGAITQDQLQIGLQEQRTTSKMLGSTLIDMGFVTDSIVADALSENTGHDTVDLSTIVVNARALSVVNQELARRHNVLPLAYDPDKRHLSLAMSDTFNLLVLDQIRATYSGTLKITPVLAGEDEIAALIDEVYGVELSIDAILNEIETGEIDYEGLHTEHGYSHPMVRLVNALLTDGVQSNASDIHFEPEEGFLRIRYRVDGVLRQIRSLHKSYWSAMVARIKVMSGMDIAESRMPQDGRISLTLAGRQIDFRVATQPVTHGENVVLRILDRRKGIVPINKLGLTDVNFSLLHLMLARPEGIILVTGPTGSGKTTTLYSVLNHLNTEAVNIMTMEDPVEYPIALIRQSSINESVKMGFGEGIRSMMRQDPDIILVGEIRDQITADMAIRAAMTGHQVFSTLHTNSAIGAIPRLLDMGIIPEILASNLIGVVSQRLVRKLCKHCKTEIEADAMERQLLGVHNSSEAVKIFKAGSCEKCAHQGFAGRTSVVEIMKIDDELEDMITRRASVSDIRRQALASGLKPIADDACRRVLEGTTSLEEISRVIDLTSRLAQ